MRRALDALYDAAAYVAALFLIGTLSMVLLGVGGRLLGFQVRGTDAYAGYFMAGCGFLALAHTLTRGEHIRVTLILEHAGVKGKRWLERWSLAVAALLTVAFAWFVLTPFGIKVSRSFQTEPVLAFAFAGAVWLLTRLDRPGWRATLLAGLVCGAAAFAKPAFRTKAFSSPRT